MIKLERIEKPEELTEEKKRKLTEEFRKNREKDVWNQSYIREKLLSESNHYCQRGNILMYFNKRH